MRYYVVVYLIDKDTNEFYYLKKNRPNIDWLHNKLIGWGGEIETFEDKYECAIRELKEELSLDIKKEKLSYRGKFHNANNGIVYVMTYYLEERLKEGKIENEGVAYYKSFNHHHKNPAEFPKNNYLIIDKILNNEEVFDIDLRKYE